MNKQSKANIFLFVITIVWGCSFILIKKELGNMDVFNIIFLRFFIAFVISAIVFHKNILRLNKKTLRDSFQLSLFLFPAFFFLIMGINLTTASNAGFIQGLTVVMIPLLMTMLFKENLGKKMMLSVCISVTGISILSLKENLTFGNGDILCLLGALFSALHVIYTDRLTKNADPISLGVMQFGFVALFGFVVSSIIETPVIPQTTSSWISILLLAVLCTAITYMTQTIAQKYTTPAHTGLIFSFEPISAALFAYLIAGEVLSMQGYIGAVILLGGIFLSVIEFKPLFVKSNFLRIKFLTR